MAEVSLGETGSNISHDICFLIIMAKDVIDLDGLRQKKLSLFI